MSRLAPVWLLLLAPLAAAQAPLPKTTAERTAFQETTRHADVVAFGQDLAKLSPKVQATTYGTSGQNRPLPLLILSDPPVSTPDDAIKLKRPVLFAFANIHAGEVDGKEALLALARDLVTTDPGLLKKAVVLLAPNINPDGNEKVSTDNRKSQNGPPAVGTRANAAGLDLNRDFVKLDSPEIRALVKLVNQWDPKLLIDCHTTNGSKHRFTLTYDGPSYPTASPELIRFGRTALLPAVTAAVKQASGFDTFYYGNFANGRTAWETYPATPRFGVQYFAARNRVGLLSESYSYAPFKDRVTASYQFVKAALQYAAAHPEELATATADVVPKTIALRTKAESFDAPAKILGFDGEKPKDFELKFVGKRVPTLEVETPAAYLLPPDQTAAVETLRRHGLAVEESREDVELKLEAYTVTGVTAQPQPYQNRTLRTLTVTRKPVTRTVPAGWFVVKTSQKFGGLAAYLLEPMAEDGLAAWGFFPAATIDSEFPVVRVADGPAIYTGTPRPLSEDRKPPQPFTMDFLQSPRGFAGTAGAAINWLPDGEHFTQMKGGKLWKVHARTGRAEPTSVSGAAERGGRRGGGMMPPGGPPSRDGREFVTPSPTGKHTAFVRDGNLFVTDNGTRKETKLTSDGGGDILNGKADWVYEEEIFNRNGRAFWWAPDGKTIAFLRFNDKPVKRFTITSSFPTQGRAEIYPYPKPGDPNPLATLHVVTVDGKLTKLDLSGYKPEDTLIARVGWTPDGKVYAYVQNRVQTWLDFVVWDAATGSPRKLFRDQTKAWIEDPGEPRYLPDGSFLFPSERTGWKHLYHYAADGTLIKPVTSGEWEAKDILRIDTEAGWVYLNGSKDSPNGSNLYRAKLDGSALERLTQGDGTHTVNLAPKGELFVDRFSDGNTPAKSVLRDFAGKAIRTLDTNPVHEREEFRFGKYERVQIPTKDGFVLEGALVYPPDFDPSKTYPVWVSTYAGPHAPTVRDTWGWRGFEQVLAANGIVSFRVDPRSASGKGAVSAWASYRRLGVQELKDLEEAVGWLCRNTWVDAKRVGLSGHSYGGFITAYALTHSTVFSAGIAGAPPTDWRLYDTIYTERYMGLPAENKAGYDETSCIKAAANLHGKLLLIHGLMDDNVHFQNTAQFVDALQKANKPFEMMVYPQSRHGIGGGHYTRLQMDFILRAMK